jgi:hypothetical protein
VILEIRELRRRQREQRRDGRREEEPFFDMDGGKASLSL